ncbi:MAG: monofunctional biosynthetic peptidoglycan transglycosylase [Bacteroidetes bacterium]|nr:monofunctional biosynthetic peptidoglycan transglycosylase [Bacteroidota bacterium]
MVKNFFVWTWRTIVAFLVGSVLVVAIFRIVPPAITPLMAMRFVQAPFTGHRMTMAHSWISYGNCSPAIFRAVQSGEDGKFLRHNGIDWKAVERAKHVNAGRVKRGKPPLGASTITMQTSKNVFLVPWRSMVRKAFEVYFVYLIEAIWGKQRILEVYVNMIEWGDGLYGVDAASRYYFHKPASELTNADAALLAAVVPNPRRFHADAPSAYTRKRASFIAGRMRGMPLPK